MDKLNFNVPSISCSACSNKILNGLRELEGIEKTTVDLKTKNVTSSTIPEKYTTRNKEKSSILGL